jgi:hypothetical protein
MFIFWQRITIALFSARPAFRAAWQLASIRADCQRQFIVRNFIQHGASCF